MKKFIGFLCGLLLLGWLYGTFTQGNGSPATASGSQAKYIQTCTDDHYISGQFRCRKVDVSFSPAALSTSYLVFSCGGQVDAQSCDNGSLSVDVATVDAQGREEYRGDNLSRAIWDQKCPIDANGNDACPPPNGDEHRLTGSGFDMIDLASVFADVGIHPTAGTTYHIYVATFPKVILNVR